MTRERLIAWGTNGLIAGLAGCVPFGAGMAVYMNDERWLWFCTPLLIFLS